MNGLKSETKRGVRPRRARSLRWPTPTPTSPGTPLAVLAIAAMIGAAACGATPQRRYEILSFFFDGVPKLGAEPVTISTASPSAKTSRPRITAGETVESSVHPKKECAICHDTRAGNKLKLSKEATCRRCHGEEYFPGAYKHGPAAASACTQCHDPHRAPRPHLLKSPGESICYNCHNDFTYEGLRRHKSRRGADCVACHNPHASDLDNLLRPGWTLVGLTPPDEPEKPVATPAGADPPLAEVDREEIKRDPREPPIPVGAPE